MEKVNQLKRRCVEEWMRGSVGVGVCAHVDWSKVEEGKRGRVEDRRLVQELSRSLR